MADADETNRKLSRRSLLKVVPAVAGAAFGLGAELAPRSARAQVKISHQVAMYQDTPKNGQQCSTCVQFQPPGSCKIVMDPIKPNGWCQFYAKKG